MLTVFKKEFLSYFRTPVGYTFLFVFLSLSGILFYTYNVANLSGDLLSFLSQLTLLVMILCPLLTMRLLCEERQKGTDQLLLTAPVSLGAVVVGKYLAAACVMLLAVLLTNVYALVIPLCGGTLYAGEWFVGYLGFSLQSLGFLAMDLFVTCFTRNQLSGAAAAFGANFLLWVIDLLASGISMEWIRSALNFLSLYNRYEIFRLGHFSPSGVFFFISFIGIMLFLAVRVMDARRFSKGGSAL